MPRNRVSRGQILTGGSRARNNFDTITGTVAPASGTSGTLAGPGSLYVNVTNGVAYINEGTRAAPYWTPISFSQPNLLGVREDFRGGSVKALADTAASATGPSGIRVFGQGIEVNGDTGLVVGTNAEGSMVGRLSATNEDEHLAALGMGSTVPMFQPDTHGPLVVDVTWTQVSNILTRRLFVGFLGTVADALDPPATGATTVITLVQDDMAGIFMDANLTDADGLFLAHNKSNEAASHATSATGVDLSTALAAAATYQRMRVEVSAAGVATAFVDKVQVGSVSAALDSDEEVMPVVALIVESGTTALSADVKQFMCWGNRA